MAAPLTRPRGLVYIKTVTLTAYEVGDLVYDNGSNAILPASSQADQLTEPANQRLFAQNFVGVCNGKKLVTDAGVQALPVIVDEEVQFTCVSGTYEVGDMLGADEAASGTALERQQVKKVLDATKAIALVTERGATVTKIWGRLLGRWNPARRAHDLLRLAAPQTLDMADAQVALVLGTAGAGEVQLTSNVLYADANSGATEDLLLPPEAESQGLVLIINNTGGEDIVVKDDGDAVTVTTLSPAETGIFVCDGAASVAGVAGWRGGVVKTT